MLLNSHPENLALAYTESVATMRYIFVPQYGGTDIVKMPHGAPEFPGSEYAKRKTYTR